MFLKTVNNPETVRVSQRFGALEMRFNMGIVGAPILFQNVRNILNAILVEVNRISGKGQESVIVKTPIFDLLVLTNTGLIESYIDGGGDTIVCAMLELANGSMPLNSNDEITVQFSATGLYPAVALDLYALDFPNNVSAFNTVDKVAVKNGETATIITDTAQDIVIPSANIDKVDIKYANGVSVVYDKNELAAIARDSSKIVAIDNGKCVTQQNSPLFNLSVAGVYSVKVTATADIFVYKVTPKVF